jgi:hypothetical protein
MATDIFRQGESIKSFAERVGSTPEALRALNPTGFRSPGSVIQLPETLTDVPETPIEQDSNLNLQDETQKQQNIQTFTGTQQDTSDVFMGGINKFLEDFRADISKQFEPLDTLETEKTGLTEKLSGQLEQLLGRGARETELRDEAGVGTQTQQLADLNTQIATLSGQFDKSIEDLSSGTGLSTTIGGKQGQLRRQKAVEVGSLATVAQALQGNIALAKQTAKETVDLEFEPIIQDIKNTQFLLELNEDSYTNKQKRIADELGFVLDERSRILEEAKTERANVIDLLISMGENGADSGTLAEVAKANTVSEAVQIGGNWLNTGTASLLANMTEEQLKQFNTMSSQVRQDQDIKGFVDIRDAFDRINSVALNGTPASDLALIFNYMKVLDPNSVVRESEFRTAEQARGWLAEAQSLGFQVPAIVQQSIQKMQGEGSLLPSQREDFLNTARSLFQPKLNNYRDAIDFYENQASAFGIDRDLLLRDYESDSTKDDPFELFGDNSFFNASENDPLNINLTGSGNQALNYLDKSIMRTDRHNNPTAFTSDIAKQGGLIEGVDYISGDTFNNGRLATAVLIGDPVEQTIKVIDNIGFHTQSGKRRWSHTALSESRWNSLNYAQKADVIKKMYQREGNQGLLNNFFA